MRTDQVSDQVKVRIAELRAVLRSIYGKAQEEGRPLSDHEKARASKCGQEIHAAQGGNDE